MTREATSAETDQYPDVNVYIEHSKWGRILAVGTVVLAGMGLALYVWEETEPESLSPAQEREAYRLDEMQSNEYQIYAEPLETRPETAGNLGKLTSPILPVCKHESATLMIDSILAESQIQGFDKPAIGFISQHEFPEIHIAGLPDCAPEDVARINVPDALGKG